MKIEIKTRYTNEVLFSHDCEDNTISKTLKEGLKKGANLEWANLKGAYLKGANLEWANLEGAYLKGAGLYQIVGVGSAARCTTLDTINNKIICGCFYGTLEEFKAKVNEKHGDNFHGKMYGFGIQYFENIISELAKQKGK